MLYSFLLGVAEFMRLGHQRIYEAQAILKGPLLLESDQTDRSLFVLGRPVTNPAHAILASGKACTGSAKGGVRLEGWSSAAAMASHEHKHGVV